MAFQQVFSTPTDCAFITSMHPLDSKLEESHRVPHARRRTSLDNSCLSAPETFRLMLSFDDNENDFDDSPRRRLSLNNELSLPTTFLADTVSHHGARVKEGLDADLHSSVHGSPMQPSRHKGPQFLESTLLSPNAISYTGSEYEDDFDCESDCDSFCDASVQEPANREYLRRDLGASCFWSSFDSCSFDEANAPLDDIKESLDTMNVEEVLGTAGAD